MYLKTMLRIQDQLPYIILIVLGEGSEGEYKLVFCACLYEYSYFTERYIAMYSSMNLHRFIKKIIKFDCRKSSESEELLNSL